MSEPYDTAQIIASMLERHLEERLPMGALDGMPILEDAIASFFLEHEIKAAVDEEPPGTLRRHPSAFRSR